MLSSIDDVQGWGWENEFVLVLSSQAGDVLVEWESRTGGSGSGGGERNSEDSVGSQNRLGPSVLVLGSIELFDHESVNS